MNCHYGAASAISGLLGCDRDVSSYGIPNPIKRDIKWIGMRLMGGGVVVRSRQTGRGLLRTS